MAHLTRPMPLIPNRDRATVENLQVWATDISEWLVELASHEEILESITHEESLVAFRRLDLSIGSG